MALTPSSMLPLGTIAFDFTLVDVISKQPIHLNEVKSDVATVIMFICNHCPYVKHIIHQLVDFTEQYQKKGINFIAINSNNVDQYPDDSPANMQKLATLLQFNFPYLFDETQEVAKAYHAQCTPDFFLFDKNLALVYRGQFDGSTPGNGVAITGCSLGAALDALLAGQAINQDQKPSLGCNIKWK